MARIVGTERTNTVRYGDKESNVEDAPVNLFRSKSGMPMLEVTYQLTEDEQNDLIATGGLINMYFMGTTIQPQVMSVEPLQEELTNEY